MASLSKQANGRWIVQFVGMDQARHSIRLVKMDRKSADEFRGKVEKLVAAKIAGHAWDAATAHWIAGLAPAMADRLEKVGLIDKRKLAPETTLGLNQANSEGFVCVGA